MPSKPYPDDFASRFPNVKETEPRSYGRHQKSAGPGRATVSVTALKRRIKTPSKRSKRDIAWALEIAGIGDGPADLSTRAADYLHIDK